jgi:hypothetical protein
MVDEPFPLDVLISLCGRGAGVRDAAMSFIDVKPGRMCVFSAAMEK